MGDSLTSTKLRAQSLPPELEDLLTSWSHEISLQRHRSPHTQRSYLFHARILLDYASLDRPKAQSIATLIDGTLLRDHIRECSTTLGASSQAQKVSALRGFLEFLQRRGHLKEDLTRHLERPRVPKTLMKVVDEDALLAIRGALAEKIDLQQQLLFELLYGSGLRISEVHDLKWTSLRTEQQSLEILGKGRKRRVVPLTPEAFRLFTKLRGAAPKSSSGPFLEDVRTLRRWVERWPLLVPENDLKLHPHRLRHSLASHLLQRGSKLPEIQRLLGHTRLSTTERYTHLDLNDLIRVYESSFEQKGRAKKAPKKAKT
jgi:integrase/recombinase XerC